MWDQLQTGVDLQPPPGSFYHRGMEGGGGCPPWCGAGDLGGDMHGFTRGAWVQLGAQGVMWGRGGCVCVTRPRIPGFLSHCPPRPGPTGPPPGPTMWLYLVLVALAWALGWLVRDRRMLPSVKDKHVFITGCDSGFGNLLARRLARRGYRVLAACLTQKGADSLQRGCSGHLRTTLLDVTRSDSIRRAVEWVQAEVGEKGEAGRGGRRGPREVQ